MREDSLKRLAILGATGSIGMQTLDIVRRYPELYRAEVLSAGSRVDELAALAREFRPSLVVIARRELEGRLRAALEPLGIAVSSGPEALCAAAESPDVDMVVTATVGYSGLEPTVRAIRAGKEIALANKETLVVAGEYIRRLMAENPSARIFPVDSEHSAVAQCLAGEDPDKVRRLIITASGGPFRTWEPARIAQATAADALRHPNWNMGAKITVDSATMLNKAFELIEAHYLFDIPAERIEAVVHPQSIVHSMVEFEDGAIKAQLGVPDMRLPIAYALGRSSRLAGVSEPLSLEKMSNLTFEAPDERKFPCLGFARLSLERRGTTACTVNGANEVAVAAFLQGRIPFGRIYSTIARTLERATFIANPDFADYVASNAESRRLAAEELGIALNN
ncbi:MAG: 1-deoxy-D-xylulose-5-phosphate reductoisomerase [Muribaculaceae bacterium]|nr:1-deoxy-D-xylulose-5-phosphate reductoisomerase [Muribaculaceae bacterium]